MTRFCSKSARSDHKIWSLAADDVGYVADGDRAVTVDGVSEQGTVLSVTSFCTNSTLMVKFAQFLATLPPTCSKSGSGFRWSRADSWGC